MSCLLEQRFVGLERRVELVATPKCGGDLKHPAWACYRSEIAGGSSCPGSACQDGGPLLAVLPERAWSPGGPSLSKLLHGPRGEPFGVSRCKPTHTKRSGGWRFGASLRTPREEARPGACSSTLFMLRTHRSRVRRFAGHRSDWCSHAEARAVGLAHGSFWLRGHHVTRC